MKNKIFLFPISLAVIFFASIIIIFSPIGKKNIIPLPTSTEWKTYINSFDNYQISYPSNWEISDNSLGELVLEKPDYARITIDSSNPAGFTLPLKTSISKSNTKLLNDPNRLPASSPLQIIDNDDVLKNISNIVTVNAEFFGQGGKQYIFPYNKKIFSITGIYFVEDSPIKEQIASISDEINQILSTFKFGELQSFKTYKNDEYGFIFQYPSDYIIETPKYASSVQSHENDFLVVLKQRKYQSDGQPPQINLNILSNKVGYEKIVNQLSTLTDNTSDPRYSDLISEKTRLISKTKSSKNNINYYLLDRFELDYTPQGYRREYIFKDNQNIYIFQAEYDTKNSIESEILDQVFSTFKFIEPQSFKTYKNDEYGFEFQYPSYLNIVHHTSDNPKYLFTLSSPKIKYTKSPLATDIVSLGTEYRLFFDNEKCDAWNDNFAHYGFGLFQKTFIDSNRANVTYDGPSQNTYLTNIELNQGCLSIYGEYGVDAIDSSRSEYDLILSTFKFNKKQIGYIKNAYFNNLFYIDIDYIEWIEDNSAPNGFRIKNDNPQIRTFEVIESAPISLIDLTGPEITLQKVTFDDLISNLKKTNYSPFWISLNSSNQVIEIKEQYVP